MHDELPSDVVLLIVAQLPPRTARLVSRSARDSFDFAVESLRLVAPAGRDPADAGAFVPASTLGMAEERFPRLDALAFENAQRPSLCLPPPYLREFLAALRRRPPAFRPLRALSVKSSTALSSDFELSADLLSTLAAFRRPLERLRVRVPNLCRVAGDAERLSEVLRAMSGGLRDLSLGVVDHRAMPALSCALRQLTQLVRLEISTSMWTVESWDTELLAVLAALKELRSLSVDALAQLTPRHGEDLSVLTALTHLSVELHGVDAGRVAQLTALRSLRAPHLGRATGDPRGALAALARLTALTQLVLFNDLIQFEPGRVDRSLLAGVAGGVLPALRVLQTDALVAPLLLSGGLAKLDDLTCSDLVVNALGADTAAFERRLSSQLVSLRINGTYFSSDRLRLGRPSELGTLTRLTAGSCALRPRPRAWSFAELFRCRRPPNAPSCNLAHLEVHFTEGAADDVAPMLRGLPALTTLRLWGLRPGNVPRRGSRAAAELVEAFGELRQLRQLDLSGPADPLAAVLEALARARRPCCCRGVEYECFKWARPLVGVPVQQRQDRPHDQRRVQGRARPRRRRRRDAQGQ